MICFFVSFPAPDTHLTPKPPSIHTQHTRRPSHRLAAASSSAIRALVNAATADTSPRRNNNKNNRRRRGGNKQQDDDSQHLPFPPEFVAFVEGARHGINRVLRGLPDALNGHLSMLLRLPGACWLVVPGLGCDGKQTTHTQRRLRLSTHSIFPRSTTTTTHRGGGDGAEAGARGGAAGAAGQRLRAALLEPVRHVYVDSVPACLTFLTVCFYLQLH